MLSWMEILLKPFLWFLDKLSFYNNKTREHDKNIFLKSEAKMTEQELICFLDSLRGYRFYYSEIVKLFDYIDFFELKRSY